jgi:hypothetical protein
VAGLAYGHVDRRKSRLHAGKQAAQPGKGGLDLFAEMAQCRGIRKLSHHMPSLLAGLRDRRQKIGPPDKFVQKA